jgi:hypothetical protein
MADPGPGRRALLFLSVGILGITLLVAENIQSATAHFLGEPMAALSSPNAAATPAVLATASPAQIATAQAVWAASRHADTYDKGMGANTTCSSCKSPANWDPTAIEAEAAAHDCASCKREPGQPRPLLANGVEVARAEWKSINCAVCHQPVGNSYATGISFWNQAQGAYQPVANSTELCAKCHEGRHGFEVVWEQTNSPAHKGWECTRCHGSHGSPVKCSDCHDTTKGPAAAMHAQHTTSAINCTACHDGGALPLWQDPNQDSRHFGEIAPERFGHALRSWPSHNIKTAVDCRRCHHPRGEVMPKLPAGAVPVSPVVQAALAPNIGCGVAGCHTSGATFQWCPVFPRDPTPEAKSQ